jgi:hypothetical protein
MKGRVGMPREALVLWVAILHLCSFAVFLELVHHAPVEPRPGLWSLD